MQKNLLPPRNLLVLAGLFLVIGSADLVQFVQGIQATGSWRLGTQLLLVPAGLSLLANTTWGLRFARGVVVISIIGTLLAVGIGVSFEPHPLVSLGAAAPAGTPWWGFLVAGAVVLTLEGVALLWIGQALRRRDRGSDA